MKVRKDIYVVYIPTMAVLPYNAMIYYPKLKLIGLLSTYLKDLTPINKFLRDCLQDRCSNYG